MEVKVSAQRMERLKYEAMLMKLSLSQLYSIAPGLFYEDHIPVHKVTPPAPVPPSPKITEEETNAYDDDVNNYTYY